MSIRHMLIDGGASINIWPLSLLKKLSHVEGDLKHTNLSLSDFAGDLTEAKGIICKEVMVGSKTMPTTFFMVDKKGYYNVLLRRDWIHANECVSSSHTPFRERGNEASIRVPRMFKSHVRPTIW
jgi:hypothetical protein